MSDTISMDHQTPEESTPSVDEASTSPSKKRFPIHHLYLLVSIATIALASYLGYQNWKLKKLLNAPTSYDSCINAKGSIIQESYPATCVTADGNRFTQPLSNQEKKSLLPPDITSMWVSFSDSSKYTFKYPASLTVKQDLAVDSRFVFLNLSAHDEIPYVDYEKGIPYKKAEFVLLEDTWRNGEAYPNPQAYYDVLLKQKAEPFIVDGHKAARYIDQDTFGHALTNYQSTKVFIIIDDSQSIEIGSVVFPEDSAQINTRNEILEGILSTFTFL